MKYGIIIPTRDRPELLAKTVPRWLEQDIPILLVTEQRQVIAHRRLIAENKWPVKLRWLPDVNRGVGYARHQCVKLAHRYGLDAFLMVDDDTLPSRGDARKLLDFVAKGKAMAAAGWMSNYGLWFPNGNATAKEPNLCVIRPCHDRVIALSVAGVRRAGNYDQNIDVWCDNAELARCGLKSKQLWYVHTGLHIRSLNKHNDPGGCHDYMKERGTKIETRMKTLHKYVYDKWGDRYINPPDRSRMICKWQRMYKDFVGEDVAAAVKECRVFEEDNATP